MQLKEFFDLRAIDCARSRKIRDAVSDGVQYITSRQSDGIITLISWWAAQPIPLHGRTGVYSNSKERIEKQRSFHFGGGRTKVSKRGGGVLRTTISATTIVGNSVFIPHMPASTRVIATHAVHRMLVSQQSHNPRG